MKTKLKEETGKIDGRKVEMDFKNPNLASKGSDNEEVWAKCVQDKAETEKMESASKT